MAKPRPIDIDDILRTARPLPSARRCDMPSCDCTGEYRAPKSRDRLTEYFWFCLEHVRAYNAQWDYYAGMSTDEIEAHLRADTLWQRPTWPLGGRGGRDGQPQGAETRDGQGQRAWRFRDDFGLFDDLFEGRPGGGGGSDVNGRPRPTAQQAKALATFEMAAPVTMDAVKLRYKALVKRHHPDANGGDKAAEERLKLINEAYVILRAWLIPS